MEGVLPTPSGGGGASALLSVLSSLNIGETSERGDHGVDGGWGLVVAMTLNGCEALEVLQSVTVRTRGASESRLPNVLFPPKCHRLMVVLERLHGLGKSPSEVEAKAKQTQDWWAAMRRHYL